MKKVLLSLSMLAAVMSANAQTVGSGAYDDFNTTLEYGTATGGIFWYSDAVWAQFYPNFAATAGTPAAPVRRNGTEMVFTVNKAADYTLTGTQTDDNAKYSPFGVNWGDDNGELAGGVPFSLDISANKTLSFKVKAYAAVPIRVQVEDMAGKKIEVTSGGTTPWNYNVTTSYTTYTLNLANGVSLDYSTNPPTEVTGFDYTKVKQVLIFVDFGKAGTTKQAGSADSDLDYPGSGFQASTFNGLFYIDDFKIGNTAQIGLGTTSAAANIASTKVFPNPATTGAFTAEVKLVNNATATVILTDMMGKQIATKSVDANGQANFETAGLATGMYTVTYVLDGTPAKTELVVVK